MQPIMKRGLSTENIIYY